MRRLNGKQDVAVLQQEEGCAITVQEETEKYPSIRKDECVDVEEFSRLFMRESRKYKCCTKVFTGINHFTQPT